jgi:hypothetical protein
LTPFSGEVRRGGFQAFSKAELRVTILFEEPLVFDMRNEYTKCAKEYGLPFSFSK